MTAIEFDGSDGGEYADHVRDEHSTFAWLLEPMIERNGFVSHYVLKPTR